VDNLRYDLDGVNQWETLVYNLESPRREILHNIDEKGRTAAIRFHNWKLVIGKFQFPHYLQVVYPSLKKSSAKEFWR
jgi:hypothetical protein